MNMAKKLLVLAALALAACDAEDASSGIKISGRAVGSDTCEFNPDGQFRLGPGILDVGPAYQANPLALQYAMVLYVDNDLTIPTVNSTAAAPSGKSWFADRVRVRTATRVAGGSADRRYDVVGSEVPATGKGVQDVLVIDRELATVLAAGVAPGTVEQVRVTLQLEGHTYDSLDLDSNEWSYIIQVCNGCLPTPTCAAGQTLTFPACTPPGQDAAPVCEAATAAP